MLDFDLDPGHLLATTPLAVMRLVVMWRKQRKANREIQELRRLLQGVTQKMELLENQVQLLRDEVNRDR